MDELTDYRAATDKLIGYWKEMGGSERGLRILTMQIGQAFGDIMPPEEKAVLYEGWRTSLGKDLDRIQETIQQVEVKAAKRFVDIKEKGEQKVTNYILKGVEGDSYSDIMSISAGFVLRFTPKYKPSLSEDEFKARLKASLLPDKPPDIKEILDLIRCAVVDEAPKRLLEKQASLTSQNQVFVSDGNREI